VPAGAEKPPERQPGAADVSDDGDVVASLRNVYATALAAKDNEIAALRDQLRLLQAAKDGHISTLREQLDRAEARIGRQEAELTALREAVRRADAALDRYYAADNERRGRGRWQRLREAWLGQ